MCRRWVILCLLLIPASAAAALNFPALTGRVVDQARILDAGTRQRIESRLADYERASGNQVVVVTLSDLQGLAIEDYGYRLGRYWGIGQKDRDSGALLIVAPAERQTRIEVGYGLEGELTDAASRMIIEQAMIPHFKKGEYAAGIEEGVAAMLSVLGGGAANAAPAATSGQESGGGSLWGAIIPLLFLFLVFRSFGRRRSGLLGPLVLGSMLNMRGGSRWGGGGGFRGGGGSFGGGGASGRW